METSDSDMESAVSFYDRLPNRFTRTSIARRETMDFSSRKYAPRVPLSSFLSFSLSLLFARVPARSVLFRDDRSRNKDTPVLVDPGR